MRIEFEHIVMSFGATQVLKDVSLSVEGGQILALLGENGAGKSTLMNLLGGLLQPVSGRILVDGAAQVFRKPKDSIEAGIAFIHQELSPVNDLRVYENMFLGRELRGRWGLLDRKAMRQQSQKLLDSLGVGIRAQAMMRKLDASCKQIVEISRALLCKARAIIMDEPTASLAEGEIALLFNVVRKLRENGVLIIFISHKLREVMELCTHYAVLRNGELVARGNIADVSLAELPKLIVGRELADMTAEAAPERGCELLRLEQVSCEPYFRDVSLSAYAGEILGVTGLLGDGRSELFRCVFGDSLKYTGRMFLDGQPTKARNTRQSVRKGIAYVPSNRKENAILSDLSILTNGTLVTLDKYCRGWWLDIKRQTADFLENAERLRVKFGGIRDSITTLSGGNQQKVVLGRWLEANPRILILDNPTQGVDIGAKQEIYDIIRHVAARGVAVIVLSGEAQEICRICHRCLVMYHGVIAGELKGAQISEERIMHLAMLGRDENTSSAAASTAP